MNRQPVTSSNVSSVGFEPAENDPATGTLEVAFKSGGIYQYKDVPSRVASELLGAASIGRFLSQNIIGSYDEQRVR